MGSGTQIFGLHSKRKVHPQNNDNFSLWYIPVGTCCAWVISVATVVLGSQK